MKTVTLRAYAKINLSLDVIGKREDGYHLLQSVFQGISLYDEVMVRKEAEPCGIRICCNLPYIPTDERNIVYKVAAAFFKAAAIEQFGITIHLKKNIPSGAGLGGGSADGAAVFSALCRLYHRSFSPAEATAILTPLGADIPFFLYSGTMLAEGIGEQLSPAPPLKDCAILLAKPRSGASTKHIFSALEQCEISHRPDTPAMLDALSRGDLHALSAAAGNVLEYATIPQVPQIQKLKEQLLAHGALLAQMTGSGSCVFGIFEKEEAARAALRKLRKSTQPVFLVHPVCRPMKTEFND